MAVRDTGVLTLFSEQGANGLRQEVCSPTWWLEDRVVSFGGFFRTNFYLSEHPDLIRAPIELLLDGVPLPEGHPHWTYDPANNGVLLEPLYAPGYEQTLRLRYAPFCP
jgi:hypothetical protein